MFCLNVRERAGRVIRPGKIFVITEQIINKILIISGLYLRFSINNLINKNFYLRVILNNTLIVFTG